MSVATPTTLLNLATEVREFAEQEQPDQQRCCVGCSGLQIERHHVWPQHLGGPADGPMVSLCLECHRALHKASMAKMRGKTNVQIIENLNNRQANSSVFSNLLNVIFQAELLRDSIGVATNQPRKIPLTVSNELLQKLHKLKADKGYSSLQDYILAVLTAQTRGL